MDNVSKVHTASILISPSHTRPHTPESSCTGSLQDASATVDDLTLALANFSRAPSPHLPTSSSCCCGRDECENHQAWLAFKSQLENRLILSAEVGQALLQRHEAYVRNHEKSDDAHDVDNTQLEIQIQQLRTNNASLEKRLTKALVNSEVIEASNKVVLQELQESRANLSRLTAQHVRSIGIESRLATVTQEKEDLQQERNSADHRARQAEARIIPLRDRCSKLQDQLHSLQRDLDEQRSQKFELSEEIVQGARAQLKALYDPPTTDPDDEMVKMLESLVATNEALKRDNTEMQELLSESRDDSRALQEELDEFRASENRKYSTHRVSHSIQSSIRSAPISGNLSPVFKIGRYGGRAISAERERRDFEPLTPETNPRPLTPDDVTLWSSFNPDGRSTPSRKNFEIDEGSQRDSSPERPRAQRSLLLLTRSRGVQTEPLQGLLTPSAIPATIFPESTASSHDDRSESSSFTDSQKSAISALLERATSLLQRMLLTDALSLTTRLKRQHLTGADVKHLSRTTIGSIVSEATMLRNNFRTLLEDDKTTTTCTKKDLRALFKLLKDAFTEMGELRMTLNDVILEPSIAPKLSEKVLNASKSDTNGSWIAPIAKLFGVGSDDNSTAPREGMLPVQSTKRGRLESPRPIAPRAVPKLGPALSASAMTVNVEFHNAGVGRAVTTTHSAHPANEQGSYVERLSTTAGATSSGSSRPISSVMEIFVGAPRSTFDSEDQWLAVPKPQRKPVSPLAVLDDAVASARIGSGPTTHAKSPISHKPTESSRLSRIVDAVIDVETHSGPTSPQTDYQTTLLQRKLRPRGLSDSSIRSTFIRHSEEHQAPMDINSDPEEPGSSSMFAAFGKRVMGLRSTSSPFGGNSGGGGDPITRSTATGILQAQVRPSERVTEAEHRGDVVDEPLPRSSPFLPNRFLNGLTAWSNAFEPGLDSQTPHVGNGRQDWLTYAREINGRNY